MGPEVKVIYPKSYSLWKMEIASPFWACSSCHQKGTASYDSKCPPRLGGILQSSTTNFSLRSYSKSSQYLPRIKVKLQPFQISQLYFPSMEKANPGQVALPNEKLVNHKKNFPQIHKAQSGRAVHSNWWSSSFGSMSAWQTYALCSSRLGSNNHR